MTIQERNSEILAKVDTSNALLNELAEAMKKAGTSEEDLHKAAAEVIGDNLRRAIVKDYPTLNNVGREYLIGFMQQLLIDVTEEYPDESAAIAEVISKSLKTFVKTVAR